MSRHVQCLNRRILRGRGGFTLVEATLAVSLLAVASLIAFPTMISYFDLSKSARGQSLAMFALEGAIEDLRSVPFENLTQEYPDGQIMPKFTMYLVAPEGEGTHVWDDQSEAWINVGFGNGTHQINSASALEDQVAVVRYDDVSADPIVVTIDLQWRDDKGRTLSKALTTALTK